MASNILRIFTAGKLSTQCSILSRLVPYYAAGKVSRKGPLVLRVEITNRCNMNCIMCEREALKRNPINMDFNLFRKIIDDAAKSGIRLLGLNRFGEPTMHPQLVEMADYAKKQGIRHISMTTNASLLSDGLAKALVSSRAVDEIVCSVDGNTPQTYTKVRGRGADFQRVVNNIENLVRVRDEMKLGGPRICLNTIRMKLTENEIHDTIARWKDKLDGICVIPFQEYGEIRDTGLRVRDIKIPAGKKGACPFLAYMMVSYADGVAGVCCGDSNGEIRVGNFEESSLMDMWNGPAIRKVREMHSGKDFSKLPVCDRCDFTLPVSYWAKHYLMSWYRQLAAR